jgi:iron complex transport system permease protein
MKKNNVSTVTIILAGVVVSGIFTALLTIVQFFSDPFKLQSIVSWTMGNLHNSSWEKFKIAFIPILVGTTILYFYKWKLNAIALGDEEAKTSGINVKRDKLIILFAVTLATSSAVAISGVIGLFGLIIPHITRMLVGVDNRISMPFNFLFGGSFLLIIDDFSRSFFDFEMPIGVLTMLIGAPFFIYLMKKNNIGWE